MLPPSGYYDVQQTVTSWDCIAAKPPPVTAKRWAVTTNREAGGTMVRANVWLEETPFGTVNGESRTDLRLRVGERARATEQPVWNCGERMIDTFETEVTGVSHDQLRLRVTRIYGDTSICKQPRARPESRCRAEAEVIYTRVESKCELPCTGREHFVSSGSLAMDCYCGL
jgi:hypothetical protein